MKSIYLVSIGIAVLVGGLGFFGGLEYQKSQDSLSGVPPQDLPAKLSSLGFSGGGGGGGPLTVGGAGGGGRFFNRRSGGGAVAGQVISKDSQSVTVKQADGSTKIVYYSGTTTVDTSVQGSANDLEIGKSVTASGTANSDGSISAQVIQLRPSPTPTPTQQ